MSRDWITYAIVLLENTRDLSKEKDFILKVIKSFIETNKSSIELFHFTRIRNKVDNVLEDFIRWRIKPLGGCFDTVKHDLKALLEGLKDKKEILRYREEEFGFDPGYKKLGGNPNTWSTWLKYMDYVSRISIELLEKQSSSEPDQGYIRSSDYYIHFLVNQFGSHSLYGPCPKCNKGSWTIHCCHSCGAIPLVVNCGVQGCLNF